MTKKKQVYERGSFLKSNEDMSGFTMDKHQLYELSVQSPKQEITNIEAIFKQVLAKTNKKTRKPISLREDFCGTGILCTQWANSAFDRFAFGLDFDKNVIDLANKKKNETCPNSFSRIRFCEGNVLSTENDDSETISNTDIGACQKLNDTNRIPVCDVIVAFNYACFFFKERKVLIDYLKLTKNRLNSSYGSVFITDIFGGKKAFLKQNRLIRRFEAEKFEYYFEILKYNFLNNHLKGALNFKVIDKEQWHKKAFTYNFRVYSLLEMKEALLDAGFKSVFAWYCNYENCGEANNTNKFNKNKFMLLEDDSNIEESDYWSMYIAATV